MTSHSQRTLTIWLSVSPCQERAGTLFIRMEFSATRLARRPRFVGRWRLYRLQEIALDDIVAKLSKISCLQLRETPKDFLR